MASFPASRGRCVCVVFSIFWQVLWALVQSGRVRQPASVWLPKLTDPEKRKTLRTWTTTVGPPIRHCTPPRLLHSSAASLLLRDSSSCTARDPQTGRFVQGEGVQSAGFLGVRRALGCKSKFPDLWSRRTLRACFSFGCREVSHLSLAWHGVCYGACAPPGHVGPPTANGS